ncbi:MAG: pilus assembly protein PilP [Deltaproteobacteria bacterium]|nr:pilus assembly protein PilP [Deltaproteobacteria bacterium]
MNRRVPFPLIISASLCACDTAVREDPPAETPAFEATEGESIETLEDVSDQAYSYTPIGKRDPFRSIFEEVRSAGNPTTVTELQRFELDQLKLTAVITGGITPRALVEDPSGLGHTIARGTLIGRNFGRVEAVYASCVTVREDYRDYTGRKVENRASVCLKGEPVPDR